MTDRPDTRWAVDSGAALLNSSIVARAKTPVRPEIQALRAIGVGAVTLYHLWPNRLTGGFVGVDVFLAVSGFLITAHLLRERAETGRINLPAFWARRAKRLLPASLLVLTLAALATYVIVPRQLWKQFFSEFAASALYGQNWLLAHNAVDYLASDNNPSPVQHYWTLSVEEQFYVVLPLLMVAAILVLRRRHQLMAIGGVVLAIVVGSFSYSVVETTSNPAAAYFITPTRIWEFGVGALLALVAAEPSVRVPRVIRATASWVGFAMILLAAIIFTSKTPFPGSAAALPVLGAAVVMWAGPVSGIGGSARVAALRPVQGLGDISYSIYLWHWPFIVLIPFVTGHHLDRSDKIVIVVATLVLAWATKRFVEDPVRFSPALLGRRRPRIVFAFTAAAMAFVVAVSATGYTTIQHQEAVAEQKVAAVLAIPPPCFGAAALANAKQCTAAKQPSVLVPDPTVVNDDHPAAAECWSEKGDPQLHTCSMGPANAKTTVLVVGDSHANQYRVAFARIADEKKWRIDMVGMSGCYWSTSLQVYPAKVQHDCRKWKANLTAYLHSAPAYDVIVTSYNAGSAVVTQPGENAHTAMVNGLVAAWKPLAARGSKIIAIKDSPNPKIGITDCVAKYPESPNQHCAVSRATAFAAFDAQPSAVTEVKNAQLIDLTDLFCAADACEPVVGGVVLYRDQGHLTDTYVSTLTPYLEKELVKRL